MPTTGWPTTRRGLHVINVTRPHRPGLATFRAAVTDADTRFREISDQRAHSQMELGEFAGVSMCRRRSAWRSLTTELRDELDVGQQLGTS